MVTEIKNKRGTFLDYNWAELFFFILLVVGFLISVSIRNEIVVYITIFLAGLMAGRMIYERHEKFSFPYYLIIIGFLIGYLLGVQLGDRRAIIILFVLGALISYYLFSKGFLHDLPF